MKFQLSTLSLLLVIAIVAITLSGIIGLHSVWNDGRLSGLRLDTTAVSYCASAPLWLPFVFVAFAIGRKTLRVWLVVALALSVATALAINYALQHWLLV